jgi:mRNA-degrading endonuclease RelE of RelBE toxin-antitoxin system
VAAAHVELSRQAERDLRNLSAPDRKRLVTAIEQTLGSDPMPANADDRALTGRTPWRRLRVGELRVLYRELTVDELPDGATRGRRIARIVHRGDLHRAANTLT